MIHEGARQRLDGGERRGHLADVGAELQMKLVPHTVDGDAGVDDVLHDGEHVGALGR